VTSHLFVYCFPLNWRNCSGRDVFVDISIVSRHPLPSLLYTDTKICSPGRCQNSDKLRNIPDSNIEKTHEKRLCLYLRHFRGSFSFRKYPINDMAAISSKYKRVIAVLKGSANIQNYRSIEPGEFNVFTRVFFLICFFLPTNLI